MYICVDFDGTVVDHVYPHVGEPAPGAVEWMKTWVDQGAKIILFTMRDGEELIDAVEHFEENDIPLYGVNENPDQRAWTESPKAYGEIYVDDLAFGMPMHHPEGFSRPCVDWSQVGPGVYSKLLGVDHVKH